MARALGVVKEGVEDYVNMAHTRIIKDTVKSTSFPVIESLHEQDDVTWGNFTHQWTATFILSESAPLTWDGDKLDSRRKFAYDPERLRTA